MDTWATELELVAPQITAVSDNTSSMQVATNGNLIWGPFFNGPSVEEYENSVADSGGEAVFDPETGGYKKTITVTSIHRHKPAPQ